MQKEIILYSIQGRARQYERVILFVLKLIERQYGITFQWQDDHQDIHFVSTDGAGYYINPDIYENFVAGRMCPASFIYEGCIVSNEKNKVKDPIATVFMLVNLIHEYEPNDTILDEYGRIPFEESWQVRHQTGFGDLVSPLLQIFLDKYCNLKDLPTRKRRQVHLSHDIDLLHSGLAQEVKHFLKKPSIKLATALGRHLKGDRRIWDNLAEIMDIEAQYGFKSTFYFLPKQGMHRGIQNADHSLDSIRLAATKVLSHGWESGLHKSTSDSDYAEESSLFPTSHPLSNRNHFLTYNLPDDWLEIDKAGFQVDTGMGWAAHPGPRNGYPLPFIPYHPHKEMDLIVVPLVLMDTTFTRYLKSDKIIESWQTMINSFQDGYCVSVLFHNNSLTPWSNQYLLDTYKELLQQMKHEEIEVVSIGDIATQIGINN